MKNLITSLASALLLMTAATAYAVPTTSTLDFTYSTNGTLTLVNTFDEAPRGSCIIRYRANIRPERARAASATQALRSKRQRTAVATYVVRRLPGVGNYTGRLNPIMSIQARVYCGDTRIDSRPKARFIICGTGVRKVIPQTFLDTLADRF